MITLLVLLVLLCCFFTSITDALVVSPQKSGNIKFTINASRNIQHHHHNIIHQQERREVLKKAFYILPIVTTTIASTTLPSNALEECKPKSHNCIRTTWTAPSSITNPSQAASEIRNVLNSYPQSGQAGVDCNGWKIVSDKLDDTTDTEESYGGGLITLEYKSCIGPAAMAINLGQPFIDDLKLELNGKDVISSGRVLVEVKSSSRMGSSDLFVNRKRLEYLGQKLKLNGWDVPPPKYVYER